MANTRGTFNYRERFHKKKQEPQNFYCKLRVDKKTIIMVRTEESYEKWMRLYPKATKVGLVA